MESILTIVRENMVRLDALGNIDLKNSDKADILSNVNKIINIMSILRGLDSVEGVDVLCGSVVDLMEYVKTDTDSSLVLNKKISLVNRLLNEFIEKAKQFNKIGIVFEDVELEEKFKSLFDYNHVTRDRGIISLLVFSKGQDKETIEKFDLAINIEDFVHKIVDDTYNSPAYRYIICSRQYNKMVNGKIDSEVFSTGSSYSVYGLNRNLMGDDYFDISIIGQDLYYTKKCIEMALRCNESIKKCLISIGYYNFHYDMSKSKNDFNKKLMNDVFAPIFKDVHNSKEINKKYCFIANLTKTSIDEKYLFDTEKLNQYVISRVKDGLLSDEYKDFFNKHITREMYNKIYRGKPELSKMLDCDKFRDMESLVASHKKLSTYRGTGEEYKNIMVQILETCNDRGIAPIFVVYPMPSLYREIMGDYYKKPFYEYMNRLKEDYNFNILDMYDMDFEDECFVDLQHLGTIGSERATQIVYKYLKNI